MDHKRYEQAALRASKQADRHDAKAKACATNGSHEAAAHHAARAADLRKSANALARKVKRSKPVKGGDE